MCGHFKSLNRHMPCLLQPQGPDFIHLRTSPSAQALGYHARMLHRPAGLRLVATPPGASQRALHVPATASARSARRWQRAQMACPPAPRAPATPAVQSWRCRVRSCSVCTSWSAACGRWSSAWARRTRRRGPHYAVREPLAALCVQGLQRAVSRNDASSMGQIAGTPSPS